jgi:hypothetical protein
MPTGKSSFIEVNYIRYVLLRHGAGIQVGRCTEIEDQIEGEIED